MITGAKHWDDRKKSFFIQTNNPVEGLLKKLNPKGWLETCGPTAACSCLAALGYDLEIQTPGAYKPQPEEVLADYLNDPRNKAKLESVRAGVGNIPGNRVPQFYPLAVKDVFGAKGEFHWLSSFPRVAELLQEGKAVQLCLKKPGHFIAALAYDENKNEIIFNDSWPQRKGLKNGGFNERMSRSEYDRNTKGFVVIYEQTK